MGMSKEQIIIALKTEEVIRVGKTEIIVWGNSMLPTFTSGERISIYRCHADEIVKGDIIVYKLRCDHLIVHRVLDTMTVDGMKFFLTKGDHNFTDDDYFVPFSKVLGKYMGISYE